MVPAERPLATDALSKAHTRCMASTSGCGPRSAARRRLPSYSRGPLQCARGGGRGGRGPSVDVVMRPRQGHSRTCAWQARPTRTAHGRARSSPPGPSHSLHALHKQACSAIFNTRCACVAGASLAWLSRGLLPARSGAQGPLPAARQLLEPASLRGWTPQRPQSARGACAALTCTCRRLR